MRFRMMFLVMMGLLAPAVVAQDELPPLEEQTVTEDNSLKALRQVQTYMDEVESLTASFRQHAPNGTVATGTLYLERPGRIRFDYVDETPFLVVADGKTLNFIDYEIGQVTKWPVKETPLRALLGNSIDLGSLGANIELEPAGATGVIALMAQDSERPELGTITLYFRQTDGFAGDIMLTSWAVVDAEDRVTFVELSGQDQNVSLDDKLWEFEDPRGLAKRRRIR